MTDLAWIQAFGADFNQAQGSVNAAVANGEGNIIGGSVNTTGTVASGSGPSLFGDNLDIAWLKDASSGAGEVMEEPEVIAAQIAERLEGALGAALQQVRDEGYSRVQDVLLPGISALAAPVWEGSGRLALALTDSRNRPGGKRSVNIPAASVSACAPPSTSSCAWAIGSGPRRACSCSTTTRICWPSSPLIPMASSIYTKASRKYV